MWNWITWAKKEFLPILNEPKNALTRQYKALFETENAEVEFTKDALKEIAAVAEEINETMENIGAYRRQTVMTRSLMMSYLMFLQVRSKSSDREKNT